MKKSKIILDSNILDKVALSNNITSSEKVNILRYIGYMTTSEREELVTMI